MWDTWYSNGEKNSQVEERSLVKKIDQLQEYALESRNPMVLGKMDELALNLISWNYL